MSKSILKYLFIKHVAVNLRTKSGYNCAQLIILYQKIYIINYLICNYYNYINGYNIIIYIKIHDNEEYKSNASLKTLLSLNNNLTKRQIKKICKIYKNKNNRKSKFISFPINSR